MWRRAKVIAISKPGKDPSLAANYRPISLLSITYKLFERILLSRISPLAEDLLSSDQAGFRPQRSTCDQVSALSTYIENGFERNLKTGAVFLDLTAAYDTVWHTGLLVKLAQHLPFWWVQTIKLLLHNRRFRVHLGDNISSWRTQKDGLPQGSVLAPTLFNLYTNDLPPTVSRKFIYADDICCATQARSFEVLESTLNADVALLEDYCYKWRLKPSVTKTVSSVFHLHNASAQRSLNIVMNCQALKHEPKPVYLGVTLDRTLSYKEHLQCTSAKLKTRNNLLAKLAGSKWGACASTLRSSALALCYSVAEYCCPVWSRSSYVSKVDVQLNQSMRIITGCTKATAVDWLPVLANIAPPGIRRKVATCNLLSKALNHQDWGLYSDLCHHPPHRLNSRSPLWLDMDSFSDFDLRVEWRSAWDSAKVVNFNLVEDPAIRQPGFDLPRAQWVMLNRFRTQQGPCRAILKKWGRSNTDLCNCGDLHTMSHIVDVCPLTKFHAGLPGVHLLQEGVVEWLKDIAPHAFDK